ncbi:hypothetical protein KSD_59220 [Ktedonobacter sp. SOSP1-85]|uniref:hypothetical protein n=1 Tax=Ktedonobacter sp. SOSP1-85 TaxID=2778367 RepID=UPI0019161305|nr:hypothetical protein [Ktedonobacter sp. SOSP1-85]GHO78151.1 hypothetical protein KSD_59220 [Ktedonobacter sp. SOSP1-85]
MRPTYEVRLFGAITDEQAFATIPMVAKMPLGALAFAMVAIGQTRAGCAEVRLGDEYYTYYNVRIEGTTFQYDREVQ